MSFWLLLKYSWPNIHKYICDDDVELDGMGNDDYVDGFVKKLCWWTCEETNVVKEGDYLTIYIKEKLKCSFGDFP